MWLWEADEVLKILVSFLCVKITLLYVGTWVGYCGALGDHRHLPRRVSEPWNNQTSCGRLELPPDVRGNGPWWLHSSGITIDVMRFVTVFENLSVSLLLYPYLLYLYLYLYLSLSLLIISIFTNLYLLKLTYGCRFTLSFVQRGVALLLLGCTCMVCIVRIMGIVTFFLELVTKRPCMHVDKISAGNTKLYILTKTKHCLTCDSWSACYAKVLLLDLLAYFSRK